MKTNHPFNRIIFITLLFLHTSAFAIDVGRFSYIPITVNNTTENRWIDFNILYQYDEGGRCIHAQTSGDETWREYNKDGKQTLYKSSYGSYKITEYDSNGNEIYHGYYPAKGNSRREWTEYEYYPNGQLKSKKIYTFSKN